MRAIANKFGASQILVMVFLAALLLRVGPVIFHEVMSPGESVTSLNEIEFYYDDVARSVVAGRGFVHGVDPNPHSEWQFTEGTPLSFVPPLYAFIVSVVYFIFGPSVFAATLVTGAIDASVCFALFLIGRKVGKTDSIGILAAGLYAVYPFAVLQSGQMFYQIPMNLTLAYLTYQVVSPVTNGSAVKGGVALGLSTLAKPITLPLLLIIPLFKLIELRMTRGLGHSDIRWCAMFILVAVLVLAPWTIRNHLVFDEFVPVQKGGPEAFFQGSKEEFVDTDVETLRVKYRDEFAVEDKFGAGIANHMDRLTGDPIGYGVFLAKKFSYAWFNTEGKTKNKLAAIIQAPFLLLALLGIIIVMRKEMTWGWFYLAGIILFVVAIQVAIFPLLRYTLVVMPIVLVFSAVGLRAVLSRLTGHTV